ncbi:MAG TPA: hypothetical protein PLB38_00930 [bacterium]|nr:hypothetical protein [bacterium]
MEFAKYFIVIFLMIFSGACQVLTNNQPAENVDEVVVKIPLPEGNSFTYRDFYFVMPDAWRVISEEPQMVLVETASEPYIIRTSVLFSRDDHYFPVENSLIHTSVDGLKVYNSLCYGGLACYAVENNGQFTLMTWTMPSSTEPIPAAAPADWQPTANFTAEDVLAVVKTIRLAE